MFAYETNLNSPNRIVKRVHVWNFEATDTVVKVWVLSDIFNVLIIMLGDLRRTGKKGNMVTLPQSSLQKAKRFM